MQYKTLALALASTAVAFPTITKSSDCIEPAPLSQRFRIAFTVDGNYVSANAVKNGSNILLQAERPSVYPGTEAYLNSSNPRPQPEFNSSALNFVLDDGVYGAFAADVGDAYGVVSPILLVKNEQQFEWLANNGSISHELQAAPNALFACNGTLANGEENVFLSFGDSNFTSGADGVPTGCAYTTVVQDFNVEGGLKSSQ